ncbi:aldose 1-epimerase family protein [Microbacterium sp. 1P10UB]|uniref:aldose 1-epimerase family protein n=1 Tax=unclassified Microbacterium TaxID=2609290 RepID=UPI0039A33238
MARTPLSGIQHSLRAGDYEAVVASVGASLRSLTFAGRDLVVPFGADEVRPGFRGATLAPWPNRVVDGLYAVEGVQRQLALTEPDRGHALHGLAAWLEFDAVDKSPSHVTLAAVIEPQTSYPWRLVVETTYALTAEGLTQSVRARNDTDEPAPWGTGPHPYLVAGEGSVDDWMLRLPASRVLEVTPDRLAPTELVGVDADAARFDFRKERRIGAVEIDHAYAGLSRADGIATVTLVADDGRGVAMSWGAACPWVQIHTADLPSGPGTPGHRAGLAVEPMTCAPDAYNADSYDFDAGLITIAPGKWSPTAEWIIHAID